VVGGNGTHDRKTMKLKNCLLTNYPLLLVGYNYNFNNSRGVRRISNLVIKPINLYLKACHRFRDLLRGEPI